MNKYVYKAGAILLAFMLLVSLVPHLYVIVGCSLVLIYLVYWYKQLPFHFLRKDRSENSKKRS